MSDDGNFNVTTAWQAIELQGVDITNGDFTITSRGNAQVFLARRATAPSSADPGAYTLGEENTAAKYTLDATEKLYVRTTRSSAIVGVIPA